MQYLGDWYNVYVVPTTFQPRGSTCVRAQYGARKDGTVSVYNSGTVNGQFTVNIVTIN